MVEAVLKSLRGFRYEYKVISIQKVIEILSERLTGSQFSVKIDSVSSMKMLKKNGT